MECREQLKSFLDNEGRVTKFPAKRKMKLCVLSYLSEKIASGRTYTEKEINELLNQWHTYGDPVTLRRELFDHRILNRKRDGSAYWLADPVPGLEELESWYG